MWFVIDEDLKEEGCQGQAHACPVAIGFSRSRGVGEGERVVCEGTEIKVKDEETDEVLESWSTGPKLEQWVRDFDGRRDREAPVPVVVDVDMVGHTAELVHPGRATESSGEPRDGPMFCLRCAEVHGGPAGVSEDGDLVCPGCGSPEGVSADVVPLLQDLEDVLVGVLG